MISCVGMGLLYEPSLVSTRFKLPAHFLCQVGAHSLQHFFGCSPYCNFVAIYMKRSSMTMRPHYSYHGLC